MLAKHASPTGIEPGSIAPKARTAPLHHHRGTQLLGNIIEACLQTDQTKVSDARAIKRAFGTNEGGKIR